MLRSQIESCAIPVWYSHFRPITFETLFLQLTPDFLAYLLADGVVLPPSLIPAQPHSNQDSSDESEGDEEEWEEPPQATQPDFPDLEAKLRLLIDRLGGEVFVKLNWSAPKDVSWMLHDNTLCCRTPLDVIMLLKGSEFIQHDLTQAFMECSDGIHETPTGGFILSIRAFHNLSPAGEFRCFIRGNHLIAVSQRHHRHFYSTLLSDKVNVLNDIQHFFYTYIQHKFPLPDFVMDVYRGAPHHVLLVDFNPFCRVTDPLLFSWEEVTALAPAGEQPPTFRIVEGQEQIKGHPYATSRVPRDIVNISSQQDINDFVNMFNNGHFNADSEDDDL